MQLVFWQNIISPHQAPFMRELADLRHEVMVVATEEMSEERRVLGWSAPALGNARIILGPDPSKVEKIVESSSPDSVHLIAGARGTPLGRQVALACRASKRRMGLITEAPDPRGVLGSMRRVKYSWERFTLGKHFDFVLAMGQRGVRWFELCGYPPARVFPFAYVTDRPTGSLVAKADKSFEFLFVGQLIPRKGLDLLLRALAQVLAVNLLVVGDGPEKQKLQKLVMQCGVADRVRWLGKMDSAKVRAQIAGADVLVLPSLEDGWGAVVNESLMAGIPVICSSACGAADLIQHSWLGAVFQSGNVSDLATVLGLWARKGKRTDTERERIHSWSRCIAAPSVARYVEEVLAHVYERGPKPPTPWRVKDSQGALRGETALAES